ncbi:MAG: hypothetical protein HFG00_06225 [Oscillibacter sp.]|nr:hypothetical protein [Oscillibacter sp.]
MSSNGQEKRTLEERLEQAARSQASSPEAALRQVQQLAQMHSALVFTGEEDLQLMDGLIGESLNALEEEVMHYGGFCRSFLLAREPEQPFRPFMGTQASSALVLLGLMLLDHARGRLRKKDVYHCTRMTLGQYVDALGTFFLGDELMAQKFRKWQNSFLKRHDPAAPLAEALTDILRQYIAGWRMLKRLDHILCCMEDLAHYQEREMTAKMDQAFREAMRQSIAEMGVSGVEVMEEEDAYETYPDPHGHYYALACEHPEDVPDPGGEAILRAQIFLPDRDFSPRALKAKKAPSPEFQALLEENMDLERLDAAMKKVNNALNNLFILWVAPYIRG